MKRFLALILPIATVVLLGLFLAVGGSRRRGAASPSLDDPAPLVETVQPRRETLQRLVEQPGQIEGFERTVLYAKIAGFVRSYHVDIGDRVRRGQLLAELWVPEIVEEVRQKEATVGQDEAQIVLARQVLRAAEASVTKAAANVRLAEASRARAESNVVRWRAQYRRDRPLAQSQAISVQEFEITTDQYQSMEAVRAETIAGVASAKATHAESQAQRDKAAADVQVAEARLQV